MYVDSLQISHDSAGTSTLTGIKSIGFRCSNPTDPPGTRDASFKIVGTESSAKSDVLTTPAGYLCGIKGIQGAVSLEDEGLLNIGMIYCPTNPYCGKTSCPSSNEAL